MNIETFKKSQAVARQIEEAANRIRDIHARLAAQATQEATAAFSALSKEGFEVTQLRERMVASFGGGRVQLTLPSPNEQPLGRLVRFYLGGINDPEELMVVAMAIRKPSATPGATGAPTGDVELDKLAGNFATVLKEEEALRSATLGFQTLAKHSKETFPDRPVLPSFEAVLEEFFCTSASAR